MLHSGHGTRPMITNENDTNSTLVTENNTYERDHRPNENTVERLSTPPPNLTLTISPSLPADEQLNLTRPVVEWIYPDFDFERDESNNTVIEEKEEEEEKNEGGEDIMLEAQVTIVVDPRDATVPLVIEGEIAEDDPAKPCVLSIFGVTLCEIYLKAGKQNTSNMLPFICLLATTLILATVVLLQISSPSSNKSEEFDVGSIEESKPSTMSVTIIPSLNPLSSGSPSIRPSETPDPRTINITSALFEISGTKILQENSPQNKALNWILYEDGRFLSFDAPSLIQRYTLMVIFYALSGESWTINKRFGSSKDECSWFRVVCFYNSSLGARMIVEFRLDNNNLRGSIPYEISALDHLVLLNLEGNDIFGTIPSSIYRMNKLKRLNLSACGFTGTISTDIVRLEKLIELSLINNQLSGTVPTIIGQLTNLEKLRLEFNSFSGTIPTELGSLRALFWLGLSFNVLTGSIPSEIGRSRFLVYLALRNNQLSGPVPLSIIDHHNIQELYLSGNSLSGNVSLFLNQQLKLKAVDLSNNDLTGIVPSFVGAMPALVELDLSNTHVGGSIPTEISNASNLRSIYFDSMQLSGSVPAELGNLSNLLELSLQRNDLTGKIPQNICDLSLVLLEANCFTASSSTEFCSCCTACY